MKHTKSLTLTNEEVEALWELVRFVLHPQRVQRSTPDDPDTKALRSLSAKIRKIANEVLCGWCGERPATKRGLCSRCYMAQRRRSEV